MKICRNCGAKNKDSYLYCVECTSRLPRRGRIDEILGKIKKYVEKGDFREAYRETEKVLDLDAGSETAWLYKAISCRQLGMAKYLPESLTKAGVGYQVERCPECSATGKCKHCGSNGKCFMCRGLGNCSICEGTGQCAYCGGGVCSACGDTKECPSCKGSGKCPECNGAGYCFYCRGTKECHFCGGTKEAVIVNMGDIKPELRKYFKE